MPAVEAEVIAGAYNIVNKVVNKISPEIPNTHVNPQEDRPSQAYEAISALLVTGQLPPGSRIIETDLVDHLDLDRKTVRACLERLEKEGLVARLGGGRTRWAATALTSRDLRDLMEITGELEALAATRATGLDESTHAELVAELRGIHGQILELVEGDRSLESRNVAKLLSAFHCRLVEVAGGERLTGICHALKPQAARYAFTYLPYLSSEMDGFANYRADLIDAIEARDPKRARQAVRAMFERSTSCYEQAIGAVGEAGVWVESLRNDAS